MSKPPTGSKMLIYVIYKRPRDYPHNWVVRGWEVFEGRPFVVRTFEDLVHIPGAIIPHAEPLKITTSLRSARFAVKKALPGATRVPRDPSDDAAIQESWI